MIDAIIWPENLTFQTTDGWNLAGQSYSPGQTGVGTFLYGRMDGGGVWTASPTDVWLIDDNGVLAWRSIRMQLQGGTKPIILRRVDPEALIPYPTIGGTEITEYDDITFSDGSTFSDDTEFYQDVISVTTTFDALLRDTSLTFTIVSCGTLRGGEGFSIHHSINNWRHYEITTAVVNDDGTITIGFEPPLREDTPAGTDIEFDRPRCTMRLTNPTAMNLTMTPLPYPHPAASFVEYPWTV